MKLPDKHRQHQLIITIGVVVASVITLVHPEYYVHGALINIVTNAFWIWEDIV